MDDYIKAEGGSDWFKFGRGQELPARRFRVTEELTGASPASVFNLAAGSKQVGRGSIRGMAMLHRLTLGQAVQVWPFDTTELEATGPPVLVEMYPAMWLGTQTAKSHLPVRVRAVEELRGYLDFGHDVELAAIGDDDALDALAILAGFCRRQPPSTELRKALPSEANSEGWIWGTDPVDLTVGG